MNGALTTPFFAHGSSSFPPTPPFPDDFDSTLSDDQLDERDVYDEVYGLDDRRSRIAEEGLNRMSAVEASRSHTNGEFWDYDSDQAWTDSDLAGRGIIAVSYPSCVFHYIQPIVYISPRSRSLIIHKHKQPIHQPIVSRCSPLYTCNSQCNSRPINIVPQHFIIQQRRATTNPGS